MAEAAIRLTSVNHWFGEGSLRKQILFDITAEIAPGEIVICMGPSGSGKTTVLTLVGALRSAQDGALRVLGTDLKGAGPRTLQRIRRRVGYIFQQHNLLDALTARQNVEMSLLLHPQIGSRKVRRRATEMLEAVGLAQHADHYPRNLSGGQRQRVAIARALASSPQIILADEPTASLDKKSGRDVVDMMQRLAKRQGVTVLLVTHDNRILDIADRILHLEDGRLKSFTAAVTANTQHMMGLLAQSHRKEDLTRQLGELTTEDFVALMHQATAECEEFVRVAELSRSEAFESMLNETMRAFAGKIARTLDAEYASLFLVDEDRRELWMKIGHDLEGRPLEVRIPMDSGIAGHVATTGRSMNVADAYREPLFNPSVDRQTGYRTRSVLCVPVADRRGRVFAVAQLLNKSGGGAFLPQDEERFREFIAPVGVLLESWWRMSRLGQGDRGHVGPDSSPGGSGIP